MPRFYFNARRADGEVIQDREGVEYSGIAEARAEAERANVEVRGKLLATLPRSAIYSGTVEVTDETGNVLASIPSPIGHYSRKRSLRAR